MMNMRASGLEVAQRNVGEALSMATMTDSGLSTHDKIRVRNGFLDPMGPLQTQIAA